MKNYLLIHGAWGAAWEFNKVAELLSNDGHNVIALDLPGHGENNAEIPDVTMQSYVNTIVEAIEKLNDKVVLVGHSLAVAIISQVAEVIPEKIDRLVYVAAMLLKDGDSALEVMQNDPGGELLPNTIFSADGTYATITEETVRTVLLNDVKDADYLDKIVPKFLFKQATEPFMAIANLSEEKFGSVDKYYIKASMDKVISPEAQDKMLTNWKIQNVVTLESGHFPLTSIPEQLVAEIRRIG
ncbi:alpha/beta fold hydrolase [Methyloprofundus sp.]|uniref:alpha/beta fold hydrolase n=1 Tax=Methyloprofundus sp. TaxID=2020875 RepID=UPI003D10491C